MKTRIRNFLILSICCLFVSSCGYTNQAILPNGIQTIFVPTFQDKIPQGKYSTYEAGITNLVTNAIIDRLNFDGNLEVVPREEADAILFGEVASYEQNTIRFEDRRDAREFRLYIGINLELFDTRSQKNIWTERGFTGRTEYFRLGGGAVSERAALIDAAEDLAEKVVDRIIEDW